MAERQARCAKPPRHLFVTAIFRQTQFDGPTCQDDRDKIYFGNIEKLTGKTFVS